MTPDKALYFLENHGTAVYVPKLYREMDRPLLRALAEESLKPDPETRHEKALLRWAQQPLQMPRASGDDGPAVPAPTPPVPVEPQTPFARAVGKPARLSTTRRRQAAFLHHYARCRSLTEAAARTGIDRRTVGRWRKLAWFATKCSDILAERRRSAEEAVIMAADHLEVRPVFYRGRKVGEYTRRDRALGLYLLKRADAEALRAEKQDAEKRRAAQDGAAGRDIEARIAAEVERRLAQMSRSPGHHPTTAEDQFTRLPNGFGPNPHDTATAF